MKLLIIMAALLRYAASFTRAVATTNSGRNFSSSWSHTIVSASAGTLEVAQFPCLDDNYG